MRKKRLTTALLALGIAASMLLQIPAYAAEDTAQTGSGITTNAISGWPQGPEITSTAAIVMEAETNTILYAKNIDQTLYPASAVKIMTCLLALENCQLSDQVTMTATGVSGVTDGGANISSQVDEVFTIEQCLYAIMVASANDIALQVAEHIGGSVEAFVEKMNARAAELGCTNTVFTNPTGLPDEAQHVTAHDMALITKAAMSNDTFRSVASASSYTIPATNVSGGERVLTSNFTMTAPGSDAFYQGCLGGKEGFTEASGSTLVCAAERNGLTLICVVLNGASEQTDDEAITILDYGFGSFHRMDLGKDDFSVLSGGEVLVPVGTTADQLTTQESAGQEGQTVRTYQFSGINVGTAILENVQAQDNTAAQTNEANLKAAIDYSEKHTNIPYYVIGAVGILLFVLLIIWMRKIIKG